MQRRRSRTLKEKFARVLDVPEELLLDYATINLLGDSEVLVTNHKGLLQYSTTQLKARSGQGTIEITGKNLEIAFFSSMEIRIVGRIRQVMFT